MEACRHHSQAGTPAKRKVRGRRWKSLRARLAEFEAGARGSGEPLLLGIAANPPSTPEGRALSH